MIGQLVGNYRIVRLLGEGGMGAVFEGVHEQLQRHAAIKLLHPGIAADPQIAARFFNEARAVNVINHPGIVQIFEFGHLPAGEAFIIMEFLRGESLTDRIRRVGRSLGDGSLRLARMVASALAAAHAVGIIHRDLKPDNVMIVADPEAPGGERTKLLDFGIAKVAEARSGTPGALRTQTNMIMGTPTYMSPEQCQGAGNVDEKTDVYALGVMLFQMLSGKLPFDAPSVVALMFQHMSEPPPRLCEIEPSVAPEVAQLVHAMLAKTPAQRPSMAQVAGELERLVVAAPSRPVASAVATAPGVAPTAPVAIGPPTTTGRPGPAPVPVASTAGPGPPVARAPMAGPALVATGQPGPAAAAAAAAAAISPTAHGGPNRTAIVVAVAAVAVLVLGGGGYALSRLLGRPPGHPAESTGQPGTGKTGGGAAGHSPAPTTTPGEPGGNPPMLGSAASDETGDKPGALAARPGGVCDDFPGPGFKMPPGFSLMTQVKQPSIRSVVLSGSGDLDAACQMLKPWGESFGMPLLAEAKMQGTTSLVFQQSGTTLSIACTAASGQRIVSLSCMPRQQ